MIRWFRPTGSWVLATIAPALAFIAANVDRNYQTDLWHHLARGREIVRQGALLNHDIFTCTVSGRPFQDVSWLTQVCFFELYRLGGLPLLQVVNAALLALTIALVVWLCWRSSGSLRLASALGIFAFFGLWQLFLIRPQTLSLVLFVVLLAILEAAPERRWLYVLPPFLVALWTNVHGAFPIGLFLIGVLLLAQVLEGWWKDGLAVLRDRQVLCLGLCLLLSMLATLVNPYGWRVIEYVLGTSSSATERNIAEWLPPNPRLFIGKVWLVSVVLLVVAVALPGRRPTIREMCLALGFLIVASTAVRMVAWWLLVVTPVLAAQLAAALPRDWLEEDTPPALTDSLIWVFLILAMVLCIPGLERYNPLLRLTWSDHRLEDDLRVVTEHLQETGQHGCVFSRLEWGEFLGWALHPNYRVFIDGRIEIYPDDVWSEYYAVTDGRADWQEILDRYHVTYLVLDGRIHRELHGVVSKSSSWRPVLSQGPALLFERTEPRP